MARFQARERDLSLLQNVQTVLYSLLVDKYQDFPWSYNGQGVYLITPPVPPVPGLEPKLKIVTIYVHAAIGLRGAHRGQLYLSPGFCRKRNYLKQII